MKIASKNGGIYFMGTNIMQFTLAYEELNNSFFCSSYSVYYVVDVVFTIFNMFIGALINYIFVIYFFWNNNR